MINLSLVFINDYLDKYNKSLFETDVSQIEWHFARHWDHIFQKFGLSPDDLFKLTQKSADILDRSVAIPIMVNVDIETVFKNSKIFMKVANYVLGTAN